MEAEERTAVLVFIDESGDPGFKLDRGSSPIFSAAMVVFDDIARSYSKERSDAGRWRAMLRPRIQDVWDFG